MKANKKHKIAQMCKALGNPIRMEIFEYLRHAKGCICGEIVDMLPIAQATVSQHLKVLKEADLISGTICGPSTCYCINKDALKEFKELVKKI